MGLKTRWKHGWPKGKFPEREEEMPYEDKSHVGMAQCFYCLEASQILLETRFDSKRELRKTLPRLMAPINMKPCSKCEEYMKQGIILIEVSDDTTEEEMKEKPVEKYGKIQGYLPPTPKRSGKWCLVADKFIQRLKDEKRMDAIFCDFGLKHRFLFITESVWQMYGLPNEDVNNLDK